MPFEGVNIPSDTNAEGMENIKSPEQKTTEAVQTIEHKFEQQMQILEEPETYVVGSLEYPCESDEDYEKARAQQAVAVAEQLAGGALEYYEEKAARSLLEVKEAELAEIVARLSHESKAGRL